MQKHINGIRELVQGCAEKTAHPLYKTVFWDWNGTLLNDRDYAIEVRNRVFPRFGLPRIESVPEYHEQFTFPVRLYYERAGVTREKFEEIANAWMDEYMRGAAEIPLHEDAVSTLNAFRTAGLSQVVLSASDIGILTCQLAQYGLEQYFAAVLGLSHIYATSKQAIGEKYLQECDVLPSQCVLLGDTLHDAEVARELGVNCLLVSRGHQSAQALMAAGVPICDSLLEVAPLVLGQ